MGEDVIEELGSETDDPELDRDINTTFKTEAEYEEYVRQERRRRKKERERERKRQLREAKRERQERIEEYKDQREDEVEADVAEDALNIDSELDEFTARVKAVDQGTSIDGTDTFELKLLDHEGETLTRRLDFALPDDTGSEWVRLCDWVGTDPERPTELRGTIVPLKKPRSSRLMNPERELDIPPVKGGLNPILYCLNRYGHRLSHNDTAQTIGHYADRTFPWWSTAIGTPIAFILFFLTGFAAQGSHLLIRILLAPVVFALAGAASVGLMYGVWYWAIALLKGLALVLIPCGRGVRRGWNAVKPYVVPKE